MPRGYGAKLRGRVIDAVRGGLSAREAGARFNIGVATAIRWVAHWRKTGEIEGPPRRAPASRLDAHADWLVCERLADPQMTLDVLAKRLHAERGVSIHPATLSKFFKGRAITFKKNTVRQRAG